MYFVKLSWRENARSETYAGSVAVHRCELLHPSVSSGIKAESGTSRVISAVITKVICVLSTLTSVAHDILCTEHRPKTVNSSVRNSLCFLYTSSIMNGEQLTYITCLESL